VKVVRTELEGVVLLEPRVHQDARGFFLESYNRRSFREATGVDADFVQDNQSFSVRNVLRGMHYQLPPAGPGKLVHVVAGEIFDVVVDLRRRSPTCGKWLGTTLTGAGHRMIWVPVGFAHGYLVLSEHAIVTYKTTDFYAPEHERTIAWNDLDLAIRWPADAAPIVSDKDRRATAFRSADLFD
jgi:dTDP-4-dehydrorhamnose 3,5-epimerase